MENRVFKRMSQAIARWLTHEPKPPDDSILLLNFDRLCYEIRPGDVILVEGRSRVSNVIKQITQSPWTHAALYIGRLYDIDDPELRRQIETHIDTPPETQLIIETLLGEAVVRPGPFPAALGDPAAALALQPVSLSCRRCHPHGLLHPARRGVPVGALSAAALRGTG